MSLLNQLRDAIKNGQCPPIFKASDIEKAGITDGGRNLSNYDKKMMAQVMRMLSFLEK